MNTNDIPFDAPRNPLHCDCTVFDHVHVHCSSDGCKILAEGGGGDDGKGIGGYTDGTPCLECAEIVHIDCRVPDPKDADRKICRTCADERNAELQESTYTERLAWETEADLDELLRRAQTERDPAKVEALLFVAQRIADKAQTLPRMIVARVDAAHNVALPIEVAA